MAEAESFTTVYDSRWFGTPPPPHPEPQPPTRPSSRHHKRSMSTEMSTSTSRSRSPDPIGHKPHHRHLTTVFSGQEIDKLAGKKTTTDQRKTKPEPIKTNRVNVTHRVYSKSLSELEFEEVKGFMELGFVFSEEDTDLISIVPGIKRLGRPRKEDAPQSSNRSRSVGDSANTPLRPYLSEAWNVDDASSTDMSTNPLRIPIRRSQSDMKRTLRCWAHSVAESVIISDGSVSPSPYSPVNI